MHHHRIRYDDFWSTGIWVGLRIFFLPMIIAALFYMSKQDSRFDVTSYIDRAMAPMSQSLNQINGALGNTLRVTRPVSNYFKPGPGAKWVRP